MDAESDKTIGDMNGPWAMLLKVALVSFPIFVGVIITWGTWVTAETFKSISHKDKAERDIIKLEMETEKLEKEIHLLPPTDWRDRITKIESDLRQVRDNQQKILTLLEK